ncbi:ParB/RepB/Spo0J family partition protein, partial [Streptomyces sp. NPDC056056]|uniref:ParB/RepB/Spo0J family partition protein n=1 Tax=Streptomyces sp. NPDC056056 TaxID=3345698 RepID=UPI0035D941AD
MVNATGDNSPVDGARSTAKTGPGKASLETPLAELVANPRNPRKHNMRVDDLESIKEMQLQPALGVTRAAYLKLWPEDEPVLGDAKIIVVMGNRRLLACHTYGRPVLEVVVKDEVAASRASFRAAALRENVERENLDVIEEAQAVEELVADAGSAVKAAEALKKTPQWVSQRRALLKLTPEIQEKLRAGEIAIRVARNLAQVPMDKQVARWQAQLARQDRTADNGGGKPGKKEPAPIGAAQITHSFKRWDARPETL